MESKLPATNSDRDQQREKNRETMPNVAEVIDTFNRFFGPVRVLGAEDLITGKKVGKI